MHLDHGVVVDLGLPSITVCALNSFHRLVFVDVLRPVMSEQLLSLVDELREMRQQEHEHEQKHCDLIQEGLQV